MSATNHHDDAKSVPHSDVHHSSVGPSFTVDGIHKDDIVENASGNGAKGQHEETGDKESKRCERETRQTPNDASKLDASSKDDAMEVETRNGSTSATKHCGTKVRDVKHNACGWEQHWPSGRCFDWKTPCLSTRGAGITHIGQDLHKTSRRAESTKLGRKRGRKHNRETRQALASYLKQKGTSVTQLLKETPSVMSLGQTRDRWKDLVQEYIKTPTTKKQQHRKKKARSDQLDSQKRGTVKDNNGINKNNEDNKTATIITPPLISNLMKDLITTGSLQIGEKVIELTLNSQRYLANLIPNDHQFASLDEFVAFVNQGTESVQLKSNDVQKYRHTNGRLLDGQKTTSTTAENGFLDNQ